MYAIRHKPASIQEERDMWIGVGTSFRIADTPRIYTTPGGIKSAISTYVKANKWRKTIEELTDDDIENELEVCKIEIRVLAAIPGSEIISMFGPPMSKM